MKRQPLQEQLRELGEHAYAQSRQLRESQQRQEAALTNKERHRRRRWRDGMLSQ